MDNRDFFEMLVGIEEEDIFDGFLPGDLSPMEIERMSSTTEEKGILWEDTV